MSGGHVVGVDVGGTFTDLVALAPDGRVTTRKVLSTPADQSRGVGDALRALGAPPGTIERLVHGTTVVTNLLLERRGARVVLCATAGATDLLELRRQERASLYDLTAHHPPPLVDASDVVAVDERCEPGGVTRPLGTDAADAVALEVARLSPDAVVVSLLHAPAHPAHERRLASALRARLPDDTSIVLSSDVLPEPREYERTSTAVAEAYARPAVARYVARLADVVEEQGAGTLGVMTSAGATISAQMAAGRAADLALSGPAGGVVAAAAIARRAGRALALTIDVGGTSADAGLVVDGAPLVEAGGSVAGVPIALPRVLVETVSAGGGSVAWLDAGGALRVGPRSAGASPGPAAFGRGGTEPTVTDAHAVLGHLGRQLSAGVALDVEAARAAVARVASSFGADPLAVARAIVATADAEMVRALRRVSVERGVDPRRCALVAFGGGGPLHACALADRLGIGEVLVPAAAGVLSALGLALAPDREDSVLAVGRDAGAATRADLDALRGDGAGERRLWARARYRGQGHELDVPVGAGESGADVAASFAEAHAARFGFVLDRAVELVSARRAVVVAPERELVGAAAGVPVGERAAGPATVELDGATMRVLDGWTGMREDWGWRVVRDS